MDQRNPHVRNEILLGIFGTILLGTFGTQKRGVSDSSFDIFDTLKKGDDVAEERRVLEALEKRLTEALSATVRPVADKHNGLRGLVETRSRERSWEEEWRKAIFYEQALRVVEISARE